MFHFSGKRPMNLGASAGKLASPVDKPNNVSSQAPATDRKHYVVPFTFEGDPVAAFQKLVKLVQAQPRARIMTRSENYLHAEFQSPLMGFVDDVEFLLLPAERVIHVRSGARLGYSDFGVNRKRVESLRAQFGA
jgi:uncharacterized protein (DUF1499 family)